MRQNKEIAQSLIPSNSINCMRKHVVSKSFFGKTSKFSRDSLMSRFYSSKFRRYVFPGVELNNEALRQNLHVSFPEYNLWKASSAICWNLKVFITVIITKAQFEACNSCGAVN